VRYLGAIGDPDASITAWTSKPFLVRFGKDALKRWRDRTLDAVLLATVITTGMPSAFAAFPRLTVFRRDTSEGRFFTSCNVPTLVIDQDECARLRLEMDRLHAADLFEGADREEPRAN
jgi:hypothetical protein